MTPGGARWDEAHVLPSFTRAKGAAQVSLEERVEKEAQLRPSSSSYVVGVSAGLGRGTGFPLPSAVYGARNPRLGLTLEEAASVGGWVSRFPAAAWALLGCLRVPGGPAEPGA